MIELYVRSGKGLNLHELACWAFSRAIDMVPSLLGSVSVYFKFAPVPCERIMFGKLKCELLDTDGIYYLNAVRISLRLLLSDSELFTTLWDWSCFLSFVQFSNSTMPRMHFPVYCSWQEYCQDVSLEKAGWYLEPYEEKELESVSGDITRNLHSTALVPSTVSISRFHEIEISNSDIRHGAWDAKSSEKPFFLTVTMQKSFEMALLAVSQRWPVLLYSPMGAGKSALIKKLAQDYGSRVILFTMCASQLSHLISVLSIPMDEQIDGKTLIGSYVCSEQPGEFRWQPGSLTQAIRKGYWVVFEDIDKAPADVQSIILPLLEGASSFLTGHGEEILKRRVRDILSKKRMVAFLLLDSPQESIMDLMDASFQSENVVKFSKYMDSFPLPFYVLLKNIEALPRTLADLLRQCFELMQYSKD